MMEEKNGKNATRFEIDLQSFKRCSGFMIKNVLSLPGSNILNSMIENCKRYLVKGLKTHSKTINLYTVESNISKQLGLIQNKYKKYVEIGSYPFFDSVKLEYP